VLEDVKKAARPFARKKKAKDLAQGPAEGGDVHQGECKARPAAMNGAMGPMGKGKKN